MEHPTHYGTVSEALEYFRNQGYAIDFNLEENLLVFEKGKFSTDEFEIMDIFRYEGTTDPADEATVYALESKSGLKGVLVTGYGMSSDPFSEKILGKIGRK
jgi:hypothetical protein